MFYLVASDQLDEVILLRIALSLYDRAARPAATPNPQDTPENGESDAFFLRCSLRRVITTAIQL